MILKSDNPQFFLRFIEGHFHPSPRCDVLEVLFSIPRPALLVDFDKGEAVRHVQRRQLLDGNFGQGRALDVVGARHE